MAVPKRKTSKSCKGMRRSHHALKAINFGEDATTGELKLPHQISVDGYYNGRKIFSETAVSDENKASNQ